MAVSNEGHSPTKFSAAADALPVRIFIKYINWVGATTAGHTVTVTDTAGHLIFSGEADGANFTQIQPVYEWYDGIIVSAMSSGYLLVYFR